MDNRLIIGVVSDTHISSAREEVPEKIINEFKNVDMILHAGDLTSLFVLEKLKRLCSNVFAVWGNMDSFEVRKVLPEKMIIPVGKFKIGLVHGSGAPKNLTELVSGIFAKDNVDVIVFGHSHHPFNQKIGKVLYFNPGSATDKIFAAYNSFGILQIVNGNIEGRIMRI